jgi:hypothetical protein
MKVVLWIGGVIAIALGLMYLTIPAGSLPLPDALGHQVGSPVIHYKHGVVAVVAGLVCFLLARRSTPQSGGLPLR